MRNLLNWILVIVGIVLVIAEIWLGAATGFDLMLIGASLIAGGAIGLAFGSAAIGLLATAMLSLVYFAFLRRWIRSRLTAPDRPSNVDRLVGKTGVVVVRLTAHHAGQVKLGDEVWRAVLSPGAGEVREPGQPVTVDSVEGVSLIVR